MLLFCIDIQEKGNCKQTPFEHVMMQINMFKLNKQFVLVYLRFSPPFTLKQSISLQKCKEVSTIQELSVQKRSEKPCPRRRMEPTPVVTEFHRGYTGRLHLDLQFEIYGRRKFPVNGSPNERIQSNYSRKCKQTRRKVCTCFTVLKRWQGRPSNFGPGQIFRYLQNLHSDGFSKFVKSQSS